ncbi:MULTISPECIES: PA14 domain-containing protein [Flavobacteriaceae]|uniref:PA14 domain-containing protein n=1 Tax=Flavobacteriaceae TaxID=49546 RepID=UPI0014925FD2|nr:MULTISPECIES: PA14 domain-containing protein [Allomuricauda]MDC6364428.1 PA14 domain-containing protein [Muricauda sp. AC10]
MKTIIWTKINNTMRTLSFIVFVSISLSLCAQADKSFFKSNLNETNKPWSDKPFYNDPNNFQFAIVSDRTGGHRQGVFGKGIEKINQLYPEFVMSVGDLIEGYSKDTSLLNTQWKEFNGILDSLNTRFFYVAGNHDYSNATMAKQWKERYGRAYYHFIYKDVLFLIANSNDGDGVLMGKDQIAYLKGAIAQNPNVRWTMIFVHHPIWAYGDANGFNEIEDALKGRKYTVFAGHTHRYMHTVQNDQNHYVLATTGGGSRLRGPKFGEFDHIGWVTMTDAGPKLVNLALSGIIDDDVSNTNTKEQAIGLIKATDFKPLVLSKGKNRKVVMSLHNTSDKELHFKGVLYHHHQVEPNASRFDIMLPSKSLKQLTIMTHPRGDSSENDWDPLEMEWEMKYDSAFMEPEFSLSGTEVIELNPNKEARISLTKQDIFTEALKLEVDHPYGDDITTRYTLDGTRPGIGSATYPGVVVKETTDLKVVLTDAEGFTSSVTSKTYRKVKPLKSVRVKSPKRGLAYRYYEGEFKSVPDFKQLGKPKATGVALELDPDKIGQRLDHYAIQYNGYIKIPETDIYTFYLKSDDGSMLYIDGDLIVDNDGSHDTRVKTGFVALKKGWHPIRIDYFEDFLGERLGLGYSSEKLEKTAVPLWH